MCNCPGGRSCPRTPGIAPSARTGAGARMARGSRDHRVPSNTEGPVQFVDHHAERCRAARHRDDLAGTDRHARPRLAVIDQGSRRGLVRMAERQAHRRRGARDPTERTTGRDIASMPACPVIRRGPRSVSIEPDRDTPGRAHAGDVLDVDPGRDHLRDTPGAVVVHGERGATTTGADHRDGTASPRGVAGASPRAVEGLTAIAFAFALSSPAPAVSARPMAAVRIHVMRMRPVLGPTACLGTTPARPLRHRSAGPTGAAGSCLLRQTRLYAARSPWTRSAAITANADRPVRNRVLLRPPGSLVGEATCSPAGPRTLRRRSPQAECSKSASRQKGGSRDSIGASVHPTMTRSQPSRSREPGLVERRLEIRVLRAQDYRIRACVTSLSHKRERAEHVDALLLRLPDDKPLSAIAGDLVPVPVSLIVVAQRTVDHLHPGSSSHAAFCARLRA